MRWSRSFGVYLGIVAMLMQLLLPPVHAAAYASRSGDPLAYALCGVGATPGLAAELRAILPAEVIDALDTGHAAPELPDCHACASAHAAATVPSAAGSSATAATTPQVSPAATPVVADPRRRRPPARAPPLPL